MAYDGSVKFIYTCKETQSYRGVDSSFPELLPDETVTIEIPSYDLNIHQYFGAFKKFLSAVGFCEKVILDGAFHVAFNDSNTKEVVDKLMEEYEIQDRQYPYLSYEETEAIREYLGGKESAWNEIKDDRIRETLNLVTENVHSVRDQQWEARYLEYKKNAQAEILDLKAKLSRCENPDAPNYTEDEINAMMWENGLVKDELQAWNGLVPGSPEAVAKGCICPVLDNQEMPDDKKWVDVNCPIHGRKTAA
jgi:hypothetical protein